MKELDLKFSQRILMVNFWLMLTIAILLVLLYELELLEPIACGVQGEFLMQILMEIVTILCIPVALKLFSIKVIRRKLVLGKGSALLPWGTARLNMLCVPMLINTFMYYQTMSPAFGYMAIILFLCLFFIYPSMSRCYSETEDVESVAK